MSLMKYTTTNTTVSIGFTWKFLVKTGHLFAARSFLCAKCASILAMGKGHCDPWRAGKAGWLAGWLADALGRLSLYSFFHTCGIEERDSRQSCVGPRGHVQAVGLMELDRWVAGAELIRRPVPPRKNRVLYGGLARDPISPPFFSMNLTKKKTAHRLEYYPGYLSAAYVCIIPIPIANHHASSTPIQTFFFLFSA